ncbi:MAG: FtsX-like permease family protein [Elusimicrobiota bacterium]
MSSRVRGVLLTLAWRNVWRNRRRTLITVLSIGSGLAALLFGQSLIKTIQYQLIRKATGTFTSHIQVLAEGVEDLKFPDRYMEDPAGIESALRGVAGIEALERRVHVTGLISSKKESAGVLICGIEPERDRRVLSMHTYLTRGRHLGAEPDGIYLGDKLADHLGVDLGDEVVVMSSAVDGSLGAELFTLTGIFHSGSHTFDNSIVYVPLETAQGMLAVGDRINNLAIRAGDPLRLSETREAVARALDGRPVQVRTWADIDYELVAIRDYEDALLSIVLLVVFAIVALGILNTLLMAMFERVREFGVLMAMGARPGVIRRLVILESCILGALGAAFGLAVGCGLIAFYGRTGLELPVGDAIAYFMPFDAKLFLRFNWGSHAVALGAVLLTSVLSAIPPALRASRTSPVEALRHL